MKKDSLSLLDSIQPFIIISRLQVISFFLNLPTDDSKNQNLANKIKNEECDQINLVGFLFFNKKLNINRENLNLS